MTKGLVERMVCVLTTTYCPLRCKHCSIGIPMINKEKPVYCDLDKTNHAISKLFEIYDYIDELRYAGGEAFAWYGIETALKYAANYREKFGKLVILSNGTFVPGDKVLSAIKDLPCKLHVRISDYGKLSAKSSELSLALQEVGAEVSIRNYTDVDTYKGGWIDFGNYQYQNYTDAEVKHAYVRCNFRIDGKAIFNNFLYGCSRAPFAEKLGILEPCPDDYIDLLSGESVEDLRDAVNKLATHPFELCKYCKGMDIENSPRIPAAEQI